ncbi:DUF707 domain-containing protein [Agrobacterium arsenijevicii]|uniref:Uncharacterized protein n=1 Tax=Agrobacterium arsenijevicii TaxID=1585697 RepID=A0ABR5D4T0_9HYPH|nr:hypothetical protein RP75_18420 [Agrobacterium arsenijevicii]
MTINRLTKLKSQPIRPELLVDVEHYSNVSGKKFRNVSEAYRDYCDNGEVAGLTPSPFFYPEWYRWQNRDSAGYPSALAHFATEGLIRPIDPAPFIDSVLLLRNSSQYSNIVEAIWALVEKRDISISPSVDDHLENLANTQQRIHAAIKSRLFGSPSNQRKRLVWVQAGHAFRPAKWFRPDSARSWDLLCNWYTLSGVDIRLGEMHLRQSGTKATAIHHALNHYGDILLGYDAVLFLDDDLGIEHEEIDRLFDIAEANGLDMFQPAVAAGSQCVWKDLFRIPGRDFHETTAVEIMMPGFSRRALELCKPIFGKSVSGFGLDFNCSETVRKAGWKCGVIDAVAAEHVDLIDEQGGAYYEFMRTLGINQKFELFQTIKELGKYPDFATV